MESAVRPRRFTVFEYHAMGEAGIFAPDERVELLDGEILTMPPPGPPHGGSVNRIDALLQQRFATRAVISPQNPVRLSNMSEPQPDFALLHQRNDFYSGAHATPAEVYALVEVAHSSLGYDRVRKQRAYARSGIPEYWIVNLQKSCVEVYRRPCDERYDERFVAYRGQTVHFEAFPDEPLAVDDILGPIVGEPG